MDRNGSATCSVTFLQFFPFSFISMTVLIITITQLCRLFQIYLLPLMDPHLTPTYWTPCLTWSHIWFAHHVCIRRVDESIDWWRLRGLFDAMWCASSLIQWYNDMLSHSFSFSWYRITTHLVFFWLFTFDILSTFSSTTFNHLSITSW